MHKWKALRLYVYFLHLKDLLSYNIHFDVGAILAVIRHVHDVIMQVFLGIESGSVSVGVGAGGRQIV